MTPDEIIDQLAENAKLFETLLKTVDEDHSKWKLNDNKWSILEIVCHLRDEEIEDFRTRVRCTLNDPGTTPPAIDPESWPKDRKYIEQSFESVVASFLREREGSVLWLHTINGADWDQGWEHPRLGLQTARHYLENWLAHDYLHLRQIIRVKYDYLEARKGSNLSYAGKWV